MGFSARIANGFVANLSPLIDVLANSLSVTFNDLAINQLPWPRPKRRGFFLRETRGRGARAHRAGLQIGFAQVKQTLTSGARNKIYQ
jgi:hypothetical protein